MRSLGAPLLNGASDLSDSPCSFYCICLLTALFFSSCYWQPLELSAPLARPWAENITTFSDALSLILPADDGNSTFLASGAVQNETTQAPALRVHLPDRCWCDFTPREGMFEPFNVTRWELASVESLKADLEWRAREAAGLAHGDVDCRKVDTGTATDTQEAPPPVEGTTADPDASTRRKWSDMFLFTSPFGGRTEPAYSLVSPAATGPTTSSEHSQPPSSTSAPSQKSPLPSSDEWRHLPWLRREYDLKPYGIDVVFDFGWSRQSS